MDYWVFELVFWTAFLLLNGLNFLINYIFYIHDSHFLPFLTDLKKKKTLGLITSSNLDMLRFVNEISIILILSRFLDFSRLHILVTGIYTILFLFNQYQYLLRKIYHQEPILFGDLKLLKSGISIVWSESPLKIVFSIAAFALLVFAFNWSFHNLFEQSTLVGPSLITNIFSLAWLLLVTYSVKSIKGLTKTYPNDIYMRFHFTTVELLVNLKRSYQNYQLSKENFGQKYQSKRAGIEIKLKESPPNIFIIFIESYGSYYFKEPSIEKESISVFNAFSKKIGQEGYHTRSNYSTSTTTGGQSWLTYSSMLYGYRMDNNVLFENHLYDPIFRQSNSLLKILRSAGYKNYNLNPINPINGITVPYEEMREFYQIDRWVLAHDINYKGDQYGFGACPPDQYSMNFMMDLINRECTSPYTYFYLTKNSHSPFILPKFVEDWRSLNKPSGSKVMEQGFLNPPKIRDYQKVIQYEYDVISEFMVNHKNEKDIFFLIGDHQPPMICDTETYGLDTPIHIITKHQPFVEEFSKYHFVKDIAKIQFPLAHEALYSAFLNAFTRYYAMSHENTPSYEPEGIRL